MNRGFLAGTVMRIIAIMVLPLSIIIESPSRLSYTSLILGVRFNPFYMYNMQYPFLPVDFDFSLFAQAITMCIPGIYFTWWLGQQPREKAVKKMAMAAAVFTSLITYLLSILAPYGSYGLSFTPVRPVTSIYSDSIIQSVFPWVVAVFIVLPVMGRQGSFIDSDNKAAYFSHSPEHLAHEASLLPGRYKILSYILGIVALCIPSSVYVFNYYDSWSLSDGFNLISPVWSGFYSGYSGAHARFELFEANLFSVVLTYLVGIFGIIFAYSILQYLQSRIERKRVFYYATLSIVIPCVFFLVTSPYAIVIPVPVLLLIGLPMVYVLEQNPLSQFIGEDKKIEMWHEDDHEGEVMGTQPYRHWISLSDPNAMVKIPFTYWIVSQIRSLRSLKRKSNSEANHSQVN